MSRDLATLRLLKAGDAQGLARLIEDHGPHVQAHLRRKFHGTLDRWQIEDAVSLAAIRAWQSAHRFDPELGRLRAWFAVIARNCALSLVAQRRSERTVAIDDLDPAVFGYTAVDEVERMRLVLDVHRAIETLPNLQRLVLLADLNAGEPLPGPELARRFGSALSSIYVARLRGRRRLRKLLHRMGYGPGRRRNDRPPLGPESAAQ
ncbi:MAG: RNA polymerase sigma factor [Planctomycetota bacterium]